MSLGANRGLTLACIGVAVLTVVTLLAYRTPAPLGEDAAPTLFSAGRARAILKDLVGDGVPHPVGSSADARVREAIVKRLSALGYRTELQTGLACNSYGTCGIPTNIIATRGEPTAKDAVMLAAHYDSVPAGPGASDDGAGVANLLEIARILTLKPAPLHPIVLLITDGEEAGLLGADLFIREHPLAKQIKAAVNMEARGTSGFSLMFETGSANAWLMRLYDKAVSLPVTNSLCYVIYKLLPNNTDFTVFKAAGYQGFNLAFVGDVARYHTPLDNWQNSSATTMQHQGDNALQSLLALANAPALEHPAADSMFYDVMARDVMVWPIGWILPTAVAALLLILGSAIVLARRGHLTGRQAFHGLLGAIINILIGGALSAITLVLLRFLGRLPPTGSPPWIAHPLAMHVASAALAVLSTTAVAAWFARRAGVWGFWFGASTLVAVLAVILADSFPGTDYVLLLAALAAALAALPCAAAAIKGRAPTQGAAEFAVLFPGLIAFTVLMPLLLLLYAALGSMAWPICTVALCLIAAFSLPLLAHATQAARQRLALVAAAVSFAGICVTVLAPTYSSDWPQRLNIEYWADADSGNAHWWTQPGSQRLPRAMADALKFETSTRERFPGYPLKGFSAPATALKLAAPELTQIASTPGSSGAHEHLDLLFRSPRGAPTAFLVFPASAAVRDVTFAGPAGPLHVTLHKLGNDSTLLLLRGIPADGIRFGIDTAQQPLSVQLYDESYGLPAELADGKTLQQRRPPTATSSQDGDVTVVQRTARLDPAAGR
jgi:MFS family permease